MRLEKFKLLAVAMLFLFIMSLAVVRVKSTDYTATIYVDPAYTLDETMTPGTNFNETFKIRDAVDCYAWSMNLSWDPTVLTVVNMFYGSFLSGQPEGSTWNYRFEIPSGWLYIAETTDGVHDGVDGNGTLVTFTFQVVAAYGHSVININYDNTYIMVYPPYPPTREEVNKENGYFSNTIPGDADADGDVDPSDFYLFSGAYGTAPPSNPWCDLDGDGDVDPGDFYIFSGKYGTHV